MSFDKKKEMYRQLGRKLEIEREKLGSNCGGRDGVLELCEDDAYERYNAISVKLKEIEDEIFTIK